MGTGTVVPDLSTLPPGVTPTGDLDIVATGFDASLGIKSLVSLSSGSAVPSVAVSKAATVTYVNNANFHFDVSNILVDLSASVFIDFDDPFEEPGLTGKASYRLYSDTIHFGGSVFLFVDSASFPPPRLGTEGTADAFSSSADLRLAPGESAAFTVTTAASAAAVVPVPPASVLALSSFAVLGAYGAVRRRLETLRRAATMRRAVMVAAGGLAVLLGIGPSPAEAVPSRSFIFAQGGYPDGASVRGAFTARDLNGDGRITWDYDSSGLVLAPEVLRFRFYFTGNGEMPAFSLTDPGVLDYYALGGRFEFDYYFGERTMDLAFSVSPGAPGDPGLDPFGNYDFDGDDAGGAISLWIEMGGIVPDPSFGTATSAPLFVSEVPLPATLWLLLSGAGLLAGVRHISARRSPA